MQQKLTQLYHRLKSHLTENKTSKQTVLKNTFWLILAEGVSKGSLALITILIGRLFGKEIFGIYSYWGVILTFLLIFADLGLTTLLIRDYQHIPDKNKNTYLSQGLRTKGLLSLGVIAIFLGILWFATDDILIRSVGLVLLVNGLGNSFLEFLRGTFRSLQRSEVEFKIKCVQGFGNVLLVIPVVFLVESIVPIIGMQAGVVLVTVGYAWWVIRTSRHPHPNPLPPQSCGASLGEGDEQEYWIQKRELIRQGWMFAMSGLFVSMYYYVDSLIIQRYRGYEEVGVYNAAYRIILLMYMPLIILGNSLIPVFRKLHQENVIKLEKDVNFFRNIVGLSYTSIAIICYILANFIVLTFFGHDYTGAIAIFQILIRTVSIGPRKNIYIWKFMASNKEKYYFIVSGIALLFNIIANFLIIKKYGASGAAITTVITEIIMVGGILLCNKHVYKIKPN